MSNTAPPSRFAIVRRKHACAMALLSIACALGANACSHPDRAAGRPKLAPNAAIPSEFSRATLLRIGDPKVQTELELSGLMHELLFKVEWQNISGGPQTLEAFRASALDAGAVGDTPPIHAAFTGVDVKIIAVQMRDKASMQLAIAPGTQVAAIQDLRGKRIAYSPGQAQGALVLRVLEKAGLSTQEVTLIELNSTEFKDALASRQVDVAPLGGPGLRRYLNERGAEGAHAIAHGCRDTLSFLYVRSAVLEDPARAAALRAYVQLRTRAQLWASAHEQRWLQFYYLKDQGLSLEDAHAVIDVDLAPRYPADWRDSIALTQNTIDLLAKATGRKPFDAQRLFDLRFQSVGAQVASASLEPDRESGTAVAAYAGAERP